MNFSKFTKAMLLLSSISSSKASVVIDASNIYGEESIAHVSYEEKRFTVHNCEQETFEIPASYVRGVNGLSEKAILHVLENGLAYIRVKRSGSSYGIEVNFRLRGGGPITRETAHNSHITEFSCMRVRASEGGGNGRDSAPPAQTKTQEKEAPKTETKCSSTTVDSCKAAVYSHLFGKNLRLPGEKDFSPW